VPSPNEAIQRGGSSRPPGARRGTASIPDK
jgi:hypothetical protein